MGSIIERKNLLSICQAMALQKKEDRLPLVVIGNGSAYKLKVKIIHSAGGTREGSDFFIGAARH